MDEAPVEATDPSSGPSSDTESAEPEEDEPEREPSRQEREEAQEDLVEIPNITFVTDSAKLTKNGREVVREAAEVLQEHPEVEVRIEGHTTRAGPGRTTRSSANAVPTRCSTGWWISASTRTG